MSAWRRMREPARTIGGRRLQHRRSGLLVQGFDYSPEAAERAAKAKTAADPGAIAGRLPPGAGRSGHQAVANQAKLISFGLNIRYCQGSSRRERERFWDGVPAFFIDSQQLRGRRRAPLHLS